MRRSLLFVCLLGACFSRSPESPRHKAPKRYKITLVGAQIHNTKPDGSAWSSAPSNDALGPMLGLALWSFGVPSEVAMVASSVLKSAPEAVYPSPKATFSVGAESFQTPALCSSLTPRWEYQLAIQTEKKAQDTPVQLLVRDESGGAIIGEFRLTLAELLSKPEHNLSSESVRSLLVKVEPLPNQPEHKLYKVGIPGSAPDWKDLRLLNGDIVRITAKGKVCPSAWNRNSCAGPTGFPEEWLGYNRAGFEDFPHASLVAMLSGAPFFVGAETAFVVKEPGVLLLGINDTDPENNLGQFDITVEVNAPGFTAPRE